MDFDIYLKKYRHTIDFYLKKYAKSVRELDLLENVLLERTWVCWQNFDETKNVRFGTFLSNCLVNEIKDFMRDEHRGKRIINYHAISLSNPTDYYRELLPEYIPSNDDLSDTIDDKLNFENDLLFQWELDRVKNLLSEDLSFILDKRMEGYSLIEITKIMKEDNRYIRAVWNEIIQPLVAFEIYGRRNLNELHG